MAIRWTDSLYSFDLKGKIWQEVPEYVSGKMLYYFDWD